MAVTEDNLQQTEITLRCGFNSLAELASVQAQCRRYDFNVFKLVSSRGRVFYITAAFSKASLIAT